MILEAVLKWAADLPDCHRFAIGYGLILLTALPLLPQLSASPNGDVQHYREVANDLLGGTLPYRDRVFEYPPYAIAIFVLPRLFGDTNYTFSFMAFSMLADWLLKFQLLALGMKSVKRERWLLPLLFYAAAIPFIQRFYLQRYDIWPALLCVPVVSLFSARRYALSGLAVAIGTCVKVYPGVFAPLLLILAWRQGSGWKFAAGLCAGLAPVLLLGLYLPWWRFAEFQGARGLQVESLYASILWLGKQFDLLQLQWVWNTAWFEVQGPLPSSVLVWARALFVATVVVSVALGTWFASRWGGLSAGRIARLLLLPLLAFVAFNTTLSPQFMIWLLPLAALASLEGNKWVVALMPAATMLTPLFYPCHEYNTGLNLLETSILLLRNLTLITAWGLLLCEMWFASRRSVARSADPSGMASLAGLTK